MNHRKILNAIIADIVALSSKEMNSVDDREERDVVEEQLQSEISDIVIEELSLEELKNLRKVAVKHGYFTRDIDFALARKLSDEEFSIEAQTKLEKNDEIELAYKMREAS